MKPILTLFLVSAIAAPALAAETKAGDLTISDAVVRAMAPGVANTAAYLTVANGGSKPDRLLSASCVCARSMEIHISHVMNGMAMMMPSGPVAIPAGGEARFAPGGQHLMILGLKAPLRDGAVQEIDLKFEHAGVVKASFEVKSRIEAAPPPMSMPMAH